MAFIHTNSARRHGRARAGVSRPAASLVAAAGAAILLIPATATPANARGNVHCAGGASSHTGTGPNFSSGIARVDPIVNHNMPMSMHEHQFYGSNRLLNLPNPGSATYADLAGKGTTSCNIPGDTAAYWVPTLRNKRTLELVPLLRAEAYYQATDNQTTDPTMRTRPFPPDLRMVAGNPSARGKADANIDIVAFSCGANSTKGAAAGFKYKTPFDADCSTATSTRPGGVALTATVQFPSCWDGKMNDHNITGNTADFMGDGSVNNHLAYPIGRNCPAGYPIRLPRMRVTTQWDYRGDGRDVTFSNDMMLSPRADGGVDTGANFHADMWNTWDQPTLRRMVWTCINTTKSDSQLHTPTLRKICGIPIN